MPEGEISKELRDAIEREIDSREQLKFAEEDLKRTQQRLKVSGTPPLYGDRYASKMWWEDPHAYGAAILHIRLCSITFCAHLLGK